MSLVDVNCHWTFSLTASMPLHPFSLISLDIQPGQILTALSTALPTDLIEQVIVQTGTRERRSRLLPTHLLVCLIIALRFWSHDSAKDVLKNLLDGLGKATLHLSDRWHIPTRAAITQARQRIGPRVMSTLYYRQVKPVATLKTPGAFLKGLRMVGIDGTTMDVPDSPENARVFGYPGSRSSTRAAFPKVRLVLLVELGTHLAFEALLSPYRLGERGKARKLRRSVGPDMVVLWDGGLHSYALVHGVQARGSHFLSRVPAHVKLRVEKELPDGSYLSHLYPPKKLQKQGYQPIAVRVVSYTVARPDPSQSPKTYRIITDLLDSEFLEANLLAQEFHQRWEEELTIDEVKTHLLGRKVPIRSENPREVVQEIYGFLLGHWAVRRLMAEAAQKAEISPLRLSFTASVKVIRRSVPTFQQTSTETLGVSMERLLSEWMKYYPSAPNGSIPEW